MSNSRLQVVDALRGFAIISIMLLHNLEHFDYYFFPENLPDWLKSTDKIIWDTLFFLFSGKSYAIFALLFGLTFSIQTENQEQKGKDFRLRFAWRLIILFVFGTINTAFYEGDILSIYAIIGLGLIPVSKFNNKLLFWIAFILMLQPYEMYKLIVAFSNPGMEVSNPLSWAYFGRMAEYIPGSSILDTMYGNLTNGRTGVMIWSWENGRVFQTLSLFILGLLAGRTARFENTNAAKTFWKKTISFSFIFFLLFFALNKHADQLIKDQATLRSLQTIISSWSNLAFMLFLCSSFILIFRTKPGEKLFSKIAPIGRMSLSNYIIQSILGSFIYYGFGLGLYQYTGASMCLGIGILLAIIQGVFSTWWMKNHKQGPLEFIWHKLTWIGQKN